MLFLDFVKDTTDDGGTGDLALDESPPAGFKAFSAFGTGTRVVYVIRGADAGADAGKVETGTGTVTVAAGTTLSRDDVKESTNSDAAVNWTAGAVKHVFAAPIASVLNAMLETHQGAARPLHLPAKGLWLDTSAAPWVLKLFDGADDIPLGEFDPTGNTFTPYLEGTALGNLAIESVTAGALDFIRRNAGGTAYEARTPAQVLADIAAAAAARILTAGSGLTGGGDLTADRSFAADYASQAEAEAGTDNVKLTTPLRVAQAIDALATPDPQVRVNFTRAGVINEDVNVDSITDIGSGDWRVNITADFANTSYAALAMCDPDAQGGTEGGLVGVEGIAVGSYRVVFLQPGSGGRQDPDADPIMSIAFGTQ